MIAAGVSDEWSSALSEVHADAFPQGVGDARILPYRFRGAAPSGANHASTVMVGDPILANDPGFPLSGQELSQANSEYLDTYRIAVFTGYGWNEVRGRIRHEFEHVRQHLHHGNVLLDFNRFILNALTEAFELTGGGVVYNLIPLEFDANCAASTFLRQSMDLPAMNQLLESSTGSSLVRPKLAAQSIETLPARMQAFAYLHKSAFETRAQIDFHQSFVEVASKRWASILPETFRAQWDD